MSWSLVSCLPHTVRALYMTKVGQGLRGSWPGPRGSQKDAQMVLTTPGSPITGHFIYSSPFSSHCLGTIRSTTPISPRRQLPCTAAHAAHVPLLRAFVWLSTACSIESTLPSQLWPCRPYTDKPWPPSGSPLFPHAHPTGDDWHFCPLLACSHGHQAVPSA